MTACALAFWRWEATWLDTLGFGVRWGMAISDLPVCPETLPQRFAILRSKLQAHVAFLDEHQRKRGGGQLLIACKDMFNEIDKLLKEDERG